MSVKGAGIGRIALTINETPTNLGASDRGLDDGSKWVIPKKLIIALNADRRISSQGICGIRTVYWFVKSADAAVM
ncbi:hypothetical protein [Desulfotomaculum sp. 1211_IL3151]|uniref:hypothetical protein n=1 Tax=Desulfotomaculum sp. 1211_IL3151 TaxID=3084055 RepID=UPI002FD90A20